MSMTTNIPSSCHLLHHFRRPQPAHPSVSSPPRLPSPSFFSLFLWPLSVSPPSKSTLPTAVSASAVATTPPLLSASPKSLVQTLASRSLFSAARSISLLRCSFSSAEFPQTASPQLEVSDDGDDEDEGAHDITEEEEESGKGIVSEGEEGREPEGREPEGRESVRLVNVKKGLGTSLNLSVKEKKELASYAHSLGTKLKSQLVGKSGVTENVATSFIETLEANELLKIKIHRTCPGELDDVVGQLEMLTGSVVVSHIGRTVIIYRPSLTKMKAEEKKKQAQRVFMNKRLKTRPAFPKSGQASRTTAGARLRRSMV